MPSLVGKDRASILARQVNAAVAQRSPGFCSRHRPGPRNKAIRNPARVLAAAGAIVALLWPYVEDLAREILRWIHPR